MVDYGQFSNGWQKVYYDQQSIIDGIPYVNGEPNYTDNRLMITSRDDLTWTFYHYHMKDEYGSYTPLTKLVTYCSIEYFPSLEEAIHAASCEQNHLLQNGEIVPIYID